jgi:hypothetical protein
MCERDLSGVSVVGNGQPRDVGKLKEFFEKRRLPTASIAALLVA